MVRLVVHIDRERPQGVPMEVDEASTVADLRAMIEQVLGIPRVQQGALSAKVRSQEDNVLLRGGVGLRLQPKPVSLQLPDDDKTLQAYGLAASCLQPNGAADPAVPIVFQFFAWVVQLKLDCGPLSSRGYRLFGTSVGDSVGELKRRVAEAVGVQPPMLCLSINGEVLREDSEYIGRCKILEGATLDCEEVGIEVPIRVVGTASEATMCFVSIRSHMTVRDLKEELAEVLHIPVPEQRLCHLDDGSKHCANGLNAWSVSHRGFKVWRTPVWATLCTVTIQSAISGNDRITISGEVTADLLDQIEAKFGIPWCQQRLVFGEQVLDLNDPRRPLADYGIHGGDVVQLVRIPTATDKTISVRVDLAQANNAHRMYEVLATDHINSLYQRAENDFGMLAGLLYRDQVLQTDKLVDDYDFTSHVHIQAVKRLPTAPPACA